MSVRVGYRADIDGLRAVAVIPVVLFHAGMPGFSGGFIGVDIFFVISGWLITQILVREVEQTDTISIVNFYARRIRRIFPSLVVVVFVTLVAGILLLSSALFEVQSLTKSAVATMAFVANFYFLYVTTDYFARAAADFPLLHTWSLAIEEQYYLIWPILMLAAAKLRTPRVTVRTGCLALIIVVTISSFALCATMMPRWGAGAFFLPLTRAWELGAGSILALIVSRRQGHTGIEASTSVFGLILIVAGVVLIQENIGFPFPFALVPVGGAALLLYSHSNNSNLLTVKLLSLAPFVSIGRVSYAWYLWHWPLLSFAHILTLGQSGWIVRGLLVGTSLVLAYLTTWFIETPIRSGAAFRSASGRTIGVGLTAAMAVVTTAGGIYVAARVGFTVGDRGIAAAFHDRPSRQNLCLLRGGSAGSNNLNEDCSVKGDLPRVVLWGDSFADEWAPAIERWSSDRGHLAIEQLTKAACPPVLGLVPTDPEGNPNQPYEGCSLFNSLVEKRLAFLSANRTSNLVFLAGNWAARADFSAKAATSDRRQFFDYHAETPETSLAYFERGIERTLDRLDALGFTVLITLQPPEQRYFPASCVLRLGADHCMVTLSEQLEYSKSVDAVLRNSAARHRNVVLFDPKLVLCEHQVCPAIIDNNIAYFDAEHVSASVARSDRVAKTLEPLLDQIQDFAKIRQFSVEDRARPPLP